MHSLLRQLYRPLGIELHVSPRGLAIKENGGDLGEISWGERLIGCINCNRWSWPGSEHLFMQLEEENFGRVE
jgi:hypothetical protein